MVKLPNVTYSTIILTGTYGQENLLISRFEEKDSFKDNRLAGSCFLCMLNRETFYTFTNQERPVTDFTLMTHFDYLGAIISQCMSQDSGQDYLPNWRIGQLGEHKLHLKSCVGVERML